MHRGGHTTMVGEATIATTAVVAIEAAEDIGEGDVNVDLRPLISSENSFAISIKDAMLGEQS